MRFARAIDDFILDRRGQGKINSDGTETAYRAALLRLADDCGHKDPREVTRNDVKRTLRRWSHPNTLFARRSFMVAFFDWMEQEGHRTDNPARQTPSPRRRKPQRYRLTRQEVAAIRSSYRTERERWLCDLGLLAGLRLAELQGLQGKHFQREDGNFVWVSADIAKGNKSRYVPVVDELAPVVAEIRARVPLDGYVFPALRWADPGVNSSRIYMNRPTDSKTLWRTVQRVGKRAGIQGSIAPHTLRHAFADFIAKLAGVQAAGAMLGHADLKTTQQYLGELHLDELRASLTIGAPAIALVGARGIEPPSSVTRSTEPKERWEFLLEGHMAALAAHAVATYGPVFERQL